MSKQRWWVYLVVVLLLPLILAWIVLFSVCLISYTALLHLAIWLWWCPRGKDVLLIYSDSPVWHDYIEEQILPSLQNRAVVLNWSRRREWPVSLRRSAACHFGGQREFNPLAVVFRPFRRTRTFRFWKALRDLKHGHPEALDDVEEEFFQLIETERPAPRA